MKEEQKAELIKELVSQGSSLNQISKQLKIHKNTIKKLAEKYSITLPNSYQEYFLRHPDKLKEFKTQIIREELKNLFNLSDEFLNNLHKAEDKAYAIIKEFLANLPSPDDDNDEELPWIK